MHADLCILIILVILEASSQCAGIWQPGKDPPLLEIEAFCYKTNAFLNISVILQASSPGAGIWQPGKGPPLLEIHAFVSKTNAFHIF